MASCYTRETASGCIPVIWFFFSLSLSCWTVYRSGHLRWRKKQAQQKLYSKLLWSFFSPFLAAGGQWGRGYFSLTGENEKIPATHSLCRSSYHWKENTPVSISYKKKAKLAHSKISSFVYFKNTLWNGESRCFYNVLNSSICTSENKESYVK